MPKDSPLLTMPNVTLTPHAAATSARSEQNLRNLAAQTAAAASELLDAVRSRRDQTRRELAVARLQSDFVSAVSHEFRTPVTAVL